MSCTAGVSFSAPWTRLFSAALPPRRSSRKWTGCGYSRAFLMVSGTLNRETDEIEKIRESLGRRCVGTFDAMPPHTPREAVIAAAEQARATERRPYRHGRRWLDHRRRQGRAALPRQRRPHRRGHRQDPGERASRRHERADGAPDQRADDDRRRRIQRHRRRHQRAHQGQGNAAPRTGDAARRHPRSRHDRAHAGMAVAFDRHPRRRPLRRRPVLARGPSLCRRPGAEGTFDAGAGAAAGEGKPARSRCQDGLPDRHLALDGPAIGGRPDGREPWHRLCARRRV